MATVGSPHKLDEDHETRLFPDPACPQASSPPGPKTLQSPADLEALKASTHHQPACRNQQSTNQDKPQTTENVHGTCTTAFDQIKQRSNQNKKTKE